MIKTLRSLAADRSGAAAVLLGLASPALIGATALAVDLGALYLAERQLQGVADAAAAAAVSGAIASDAHADVQRTLAASGHAGATAMIELGAYRSDANIPIANRFDPSSAEINAVRVELRESVDLFFGNILTGSETTVVRARATAARRDMIAFDIGSRLIATTGGLPNAILSQLAGVPLDLDEETLAQLGGTKIDVIDFADELRKLQGAPGRTFGETFDQSTEVAMAIRAMAAASPDPGTRSALLAIADRLTTAPLVVSDLIELGPFRDRDVNEQGGNASVDAYSLLRSLLEASRGETYEIALDADALGIAGASVRIAGSRGYERSPWLTLTSAYDVVLRTAQTRIGVQTRVATGLGELNVPIFTEFAAAEARVETVECPRVRSDQAATLAVTPSLAEVALAEIDSGTFGDFRSALTYKPAQVLNLPLLMVTALADLSLGGGSAQLVPFSRSEIDDGTRKVAGTNDLVATAASSLSEDVEIGVTAGGLPLGGGLSAVSDTVGTALAAAAPAVDGLLTRLTDALGVKLGAADVGVIGLRCGRASIVA